MMKTIQNHCGQISPHLHIGVSQGHEEGEQNTLGN